MARHGDSPDPVFLSPSAYAAFGLIQLSTAGILYRMALRVLPTTWITTWSFWNTQFQWV
jgi:hypothetical protein